MKQVVVFIRSMKFLGTQIVSYPLLYQIKQFWPDCHLRVVAQDEVGRHYLSLPWVDEFVRADRLSEVYAAMRRQDDLLIVLHFASDKYGVAALLKRPRVRLGFKNHRVTDFVWTHSHPKDFSEYMGLGNLKVLASYRAFDPDEAARQCVQALAALAQTPVPSADVVLMPGGGAGDWKRWPIQQYVELADALKPALESVLPDRRAPRFCFVLGPDEAKEYAWLQSLKRDDFSYLMTQPVFEISRAVLQARLIVANDCGPSHLAQFSGVPYVGVFHEPNREWFWTRDTSADVIPADGTTEIRHVQVQDVLRASLKVLQLPLSTAR